MDFYQKINAPFKRNPKGVMLMNHWCMPELEYLAENAWEFSEKVDGTNICVVVTRHEDFCTTEFFGRTSKSDIPRPLATHLHAKFGDANFVGGQIFDGWSVRDLRGTSSTVILYGEGFGGNIQKTGPLYGPDASFAIFDVKIDGWWLGRSDVEDIARKLRVPVVPLVGHGTLFDAMDMVASGLQSQWGDFTAEGIVARPTVALHDRAGKRIITKVKTRDFDGFV